MTTAGEEPRRTLGPTRLSSYAAILFDLDGVLVDSMHIVRELWQRWATERGLDIERVRAASRGGPGLQTLRRLFPGEDVDAEAARLSELEHSFVGRVTPMAGALDTLGQVITTGTPWAVVTSGTRRVAMGRIDHCQIPDPPLLVTAEDTHRGKPFPEPYLEAAARLSVSPDRCIVVEDSPGGVEAGASAGATVVALAGSHDASRLTRAHHVVDRLSSLHFEAGDSGLDLILRSPREG